MDRGKPHGRTGSNVGLGAMAAMSVLLCAQTAQAACSIEQVGATKRQIIRCDNGVTVRPEPGASYTLLDRDRSGSIDAVRLTGKAVLIEVPKGTKFEVVSPQAIAAVRGTRWAVDVGGGKTSVFVATGSVGVRRPAGGAGVTLGPGEGVDVAAGSEPLVKKRWGTPRVGALLARLGQ